MEPINFCEAIHVETDSDGLTCFLKTDVCDRFQIEVTPSSEDICLLPAQSGEGPAQYLTYAGILRALVLSSDRVAQSFVLWAADILFTAQMGSMSAKRELASSLLGVSAAGDTPCIYLYDIGSVKVELL